MKIYVNDSNEIHDVGSTTDPTLREIYILDEPDANPFLTWPVARILCYRVEVVEGVVMMMTPYIDSRIVEQLAGVGHATEVNAADVTDLQIATADNFEEIMAATDDITDLQVASADTFEEVLTNGSDITDLQLAVTDLYEMILG